MSRPTRQRRLIGEALARTDAFRTAQEVHAELRSSGAPVGLTTVYRTLQAMAESGEVDALRTDSGEVAYRRCGTTGHHHHLVCLECGRSVEVAARPVEQWAARTAAQHGFTEVSHTVEVFGRCRDCA